MCAVGQEACIEKSSRLASLNPCRPAFFLLLLFYRAWPVSRPLCGPLCVQLALAGPVWFGPVQSRVESGLAESDAQCALCRREAGQMGCGLSSPFNRLCVIVLVCALMPLPLPAQLYSSARNWISSESGFASSLAGHRMPNPKSLRIAVIRSIIRS